jgi:anaerobic magnesium-protoporphyrin IX monomethyl ester cyclase
MRVLLFQVPIDIEVISGVPFSTAQTPISLGYIAAMLKNRGIDVEIVDLVSDPKARPTIARPGVFALKRMIEEKKPDIVGFSAHNSNMEEIIGIARACKEVDPVIWTVIGGPQATFMPSKALDEMPSIDIIARGEGEYLMLDLVDAVEGKMGFKDVEGIVFRDDGRILSTPERPLTEDLDELPSPYIEEVFPMGRYIVATFLTSRGCRHNCAFCYTPKAFQRRIRCHSPEYVLRDVERVREEVQVLWFADPNFAGVRDHATGILKGLIERKNDLPIWCETRFDNVDAELLRLMKGAGVESIFFGLESGDQEILNSVHKGIRLDRVRDVVRATKRAGIKVELSVVLGLPGETKEQALKTIELVRSLEPDKVTLNRLRLYFGTEIYENREKHGIKVLGKLPGYKSPEHEYEMQTLSASEIEGIIKGEGMDLPEEEDEYINYFASFVAHGKADLSRVTTVIPTEYGNLPVPNVSRHLLSFY